MNRRELLEMLGAGACISAFPQLSWSQNGAAANRVLVVFCRGGWDQTFHLDPKFGVDNVDGPETTPTPQAVGNPMNQESIEEFSGLRIGTNPLVRPEILRFFESYAGQSLVVNGIDVDSISHPVCTRRVLTGRRGEGGADVGAIIGSTAGSDFPFPYLDIAGSAFSGPLASAVGTVGARNQLQLLLDENLTAIQNQRGRLFVPDNTIAATPVKGAESILRRHLLARTRKLKAAARGARSNTHFDDLMGSLERSTLITDDDNIRASIRALPFGGTATVSDQANLALDLMGKGVCHSAMIEATPFDTHQTNADQHAVANTVFGALNEIFQNENPMSAAGMAKSQVLDNLTVIVLSEMGRTPGLNETQGKDHWPIASALITGRPVAGGRMVGGTEANSLSPLPNSGLTYDTFAAGLLKYMGVNNTNDWLPGVRPYEIG